MFTLIKLFMKECNILKMTDLTSTPMIPSIMPWLLTDPAEWLLINGHLISCGIAITPEFYKSSRPLENYPLLRIKLTSLKLSEEISPLLVDKLSLNMMQPMDSHSTTKLKLKLPIAIGIKPCVMLLKIQDVLNLNKRLWPLDLCVSLLVMYWGKMVINKISSILLWINLLKVLLQLMLLSTLFVRL